MAPVDRRRFLRQTLAGVAALSGGSALPRLTSLSARPPRAAAPQNLLVIGAGMAGLSAALQLIATGHRVTILEARSRPGGRVFTIREPFADGFHAEGGAMQLFDTHTRVQRYVQELGLEIDPIRPPPATSVMHVMGKRIEVKPGERVRWPFEVNDDEKDLDSRALSQKYAGTALQEIAEIEARDPLLRSLEKYDRVTYAEFLRARGASPAAIAILAAGLPSGLGDGAHRVSALDLLREAAHRAARTQSFTVRGGTDRLPKALAARLGDNIHYGTAVIRLEHNETGTRVVARQGGATRVFTADRIICTIPFTVLRRIEVSPPFGREKRAAVERLRYTSVARVFVQTRTRFWTAEGLSGTASTDLPVMGIYERTINQAGRRGILESYIAGANARRATAMSKEDRLAMTLREMAKVFPRILDEYEGGTSMCWDADEWARGAYAWFEPGQMATLMPHVATPEGRIHFAGDHASTSPGWMEGALESADRVVREIESSSSSSGKDS